MMDMKSSKAIPGEGKNQRREIFRLARLQFHVTCWVDLVNDLLELRLVVSELLISELSRYTAKILEVNEA